jgi:hypothetical protein
LDHLLTPTSIAASQETTKPAITNGDSKANDDKSTVVFEKVQGQTNGSKLTSIKPAVGYKEQLEIDRKERPLASGRKAGQRWERSAIRFAPMNVPLQRRYVSFTSISHDMSNIPVKLWLMRADS